MWIFHCVEGVGALNPYVVQVSSAYPKLIRGMKSFIFTTLPYVQGHRIILGMENRGQEYWGSSQNSAYYTSKSQIFTLWICGNVTSPPPHIFSHQFGL